MAVQSVEKFNHGIVFGHNCYNMGQCNVTFVYVTVVWFRNLLGVLAAPAVSQ